jgi:hypothetical protein
MKLFPADKKNAHVLGPTCYLNATGGFKRKEGKSLREIENMQNEREMMKAQNAGVGLLLEHKSG